ncbi:MAG: hypothetical protein HPY79_01645 [Bacteroidales bacterium]|nr:hypothetical protein [Bacteroidales bacterium]
MDEEIIQRIVYIIIGIVLFVVFNKKKAKTQASQTTPNKNTESTIQTPDQKNYTKPISNSTSKIEKTTFTTMTSSLETTSENLEMIEDEIISDHRIIKNKKHLNETKENNEPNFKINYDDLKKAVILSDVVKPKYF